MQSVVPEVEIIYNCIEYAHLFTFPLLTPSSGDSNLKRNLRCSPGSSVYMVTVLLSGRTLFGSNNCAREHSLIHSWLSRHASNSEPTGGSFGGNLTDGS